MIMISIWNIIGILIAVWMVLTGHFPLNLSIALRGFRMNRGAFEPVGEWVRISGSCYLVGTFLSILGRVGILPGTEEFWYIVFCICSGAAAVSLFISFIRFQS